MRGIGLVIPVLLGVVAGACAALAFAVFAPNAFPGRAYLQARQDEHRDYADAGSLPRDQLARLLLGREATKFVGDTRKRQDLKYGVGFYSQPRAAGDVLCRVGFVWLPERIVRGYGSQPFDPQGKGDMTQHNLFGVWERPGETTNGEGLLRVYQRALACANYRDFDHLITSLTDDGIAVERAVNALDLAATQAKSGKVDFRLRCFDARDHSHQKECDGRAMLARLDVLKDIQQVDSDAPELSDAADSHRDLVVLRRPGPLGCGKNDDVQLDVTSTRTFDGRQVEREVPNAISIVITTIC
jgi:hypothetical protein